jgi:hypothetical protein
MCVFESLLSIRKDNESLSCNLSSSSIARIKSEFEPYIRPYIILYQTIPCDDRRVFGKILVEWKQHQRGDDMVKVIRFIKFNESSEDKWSTESIDWPFNVDRDLV